MNKRYIIAIPLGLIMSPVLLAGAVFGFVARYFEAGVAMYNGAENALEDWLDK